MKCRVSGASMRRQCGQGDSGIDYILHGPNFSWSTLAATLNLGIFGRGGIYKEEDAIVGDQVDVVRMARDAVHKPVHGDSGLAYEEGRIMAEYGAGGQ